MTAAPATPAAAATRRARTGPASAVKRKDIQGLRALAVTLVVVFHLVPSVVPGGYIGVDVFFVISGFLISGHLLRELEHTGSVRITEFWARRVRRLLPASLLVLLVCAVLTIFVMPGITREQNFLEIAFAAVYVLNWNLAAGAVDYLNATNPTSLVQHYWSLSVEEQFYLIWPVLLSVAVLLALKWRRRRARRDDAVVLTSASVVRRAVLAVLLLVFVLSLLFSIVETARSQPSAYFITTTRAWEFALGGLVALLPRATLPDAVRAVVGWVAVAAIAWAAFAFGPTTAFPGSIALIPVGATAILIWAGDSSRAYAPQRLAHGRLVQTVGDLSYAIYLWHWPLVIVVTLKAEEAPLWVRCLLIVVATFALAFVTERFVERPFRKPRGLFRRRSVTFGAMALSIAVIMLLVIPPAHAIRSDVEQRQEELQGLITDDPANATGCTGAQAVYNDCDSPFRYTEGIDPTFAQGDGPWTWFEAEPGLSRCESRTVGSWVERSCGFEGDSGAPGVLLIGDSHADHLVSPLERVATAEGWSLGVETRQACNPFRTAAEADANDENAARCVEWGRQTIADAAADPGVDTVIVSTRSDSGVWPDNAAASFRALLDAGKKVILVTDVPNVDGRDARDGDLITGPACVLAAGAVDDACSWTDVPDDPWLIDAATASGVTLLDLRSVLCPDGTCHAVVGGLIAYADENHLSGSYALSLAGWFARELVPLVGE